MSPASYRAAPPRVGASNNRGLVAVLQNLEESLEGKLGYFCAATAAAIAAAVAAQK